MRVLQTKDKISLLNWGHFTELNSHNVAAPMSHNKYEVTGYIEYRYVLNEFLSVSINLTLV